MENSQNDKSVAMDIPEINNLRDEFNLQRARMKEIYIQKDLEGKKLAKDLNLMKRELDETKSQLTIVEYNKSLDIEEQARQILSLQNLIHETIEESSMSASEIKRLADDNERLKQENLDLKEALVQQQQDSTSLAPVLSQMKKTIARKLGGSDSTSDSPLDDSMRKAQEDAEVLRSLVVPLEDEIKQLKEKLRSAYDEMEQLKGPEVQTQSALVGMLRETKKESVEANIEPLGAASSVAQEQECELCKNYEMKLVQSQETINADKLKLLKSEKTNERMREDLAKESQLRLELEGQWQEKREEHKDEVQKLCDQLNASEQKLVNLRDKFLHFKDDINKELLRVVEERQQIHEHLNTLQKDNDYLSGSYLQNSESLNDQEINLPQNIEELQELVLKMRENLIVAKVGCEYNESKCISFKDESQLLRDQLHSRDRERIVIEQKMNQRIQVLEDKLKQGSQMYQKLMTEKEELQRVEVDYKKQTSELRMQNIDLTEKYDRFEKTNHDLKSKLSMMQQELVTNEAVQKDFVKLSQSLQVQLEKIRSEDAQVRWQDEEDVDKCNNCKKEFTVTRRKVHCRHCGTIYCPLCVTKVVKSGVHLKPAKVCDVCHTLLVQNTAPFFTTLSDDPTN